MTAPLALLLLGPTASGKSALSLALARRHPVEIISIDSALVYRGMDIGSAKPTPEERSVCPHHLIDVREIDEPYSAADFLTDTAKLVPEIRARGRVPLIVGGTMLYAKALREGLNDLPTTPPEVRSEVLEEGERLGWPAMWEKLREIDPETAARLQPADRQRIGRAIEVWRMTGKTLSSFHAKEAEPLFPMLSVGLLPPDRKLLHRRIEERFDAMFTGFVPEDLKKLLFALIASPRFRDMRLIGYKATFDETTHTQFSATTYLWRDSLAFVAFRGTDTSFCGWRENFDMTYIDESGEKRRPYIIHRSSIGCYERTLALLIEKYAGAFPVWLAPTQIKVASLTDRNAQKAREITNALKAAGLRAEEDTRNETLGYKIRSWQMEKVPYMLIIGDKETEENVVAVRRRGEGDKGKMTLSDFIAAVKADVESKRLD